jgi:hypothetical protein
VAATRNSLLVIPRTGKDNISIDAKLDRFGGPITLPFKTGVGKDITIDAPISGRIQIAGLTNNMSGVADVSLGSGNIAGEPLQNGSARATFAGSTITLEKIDLSFDAGHLVASGKIDKATQAFEIQASGDRIQLARLEALDRQSEDAEARRDGNGHLFESIRHAERYGFFCVSNRIQRRK